MTDLADGLYMCRFTVPVGDSRILRRTADRWFWVPGGDEILEPWASRIVPVSRLIEVPLEGETT